MEPDSDEDYMHRDPPLAGGPRVGAVGGSGAGAGSGGEIAGGGGEGAEPGGGDGCGAKGEEEHAVEGPEVGVGLPQGRGGACLAGEP
uniref:Uncharacterized protein n=1 Tax=Arundo donax TaxID=35708 RepID=A0A0A9GXR6_ARUDO